MAVAWTALGTAWAVAQELPDPSQMQFGRSVTIEAAHKEVDLKTNLVTFSGDVQVTYDVEVIRADRVVVVLDPTGTESEPGRYRVLHGTATGNVKLIDPDGIVESDELTYDWTTRSGTASRVKMDVAGVRITAESANLRPGMYELVGVWGTSCPGLFELRSRRVVVVPGSRARVEKPLLRVAGTQLPALPTQSYGLTSRTTGLRMPTLSFKRGEGVGVAWRSSFDLGSNTALAASFRATPNRMPGYGLQLTRTFAPDSGPSSPRSELDERFSYGFLEHIGVPSPSFEREFLAETRHTLSVNSLWNLRVDARTTSYELSKPIEAVYERGGTIGRGSALAQLRLQSLDVSGAPSEHRAIGFLSYDPGLQPFTSNLEPLIRVDAAAFAGRSSFGWGRVQAGLAFMPTRQVRLSGAFMMGNEFGSPAYEFDRLYATRAFHARADFDLGPTKISLLGKYDLDRRVWYDREYSISQVAGCLEPYILYRQFPSGFRFGIRLRLDDFLELLNRRDWGKRSKSKTTMKH